MRLLNVKSIKKEKDYFDVIYTVLMCIYLLLPNSFLSIRSILIIDFFCIPNSSQHGDLHMTGTHNTYRKNYLDLMFSIP